MSVTRDISDSTADAKSLFLRLFFQQPALLLIRIKEKGYIFFVRFEDLEWTEAVTETA
jgi:hypothetical protein